MLKGRAKTDEAKEAVMAKLLQVWKSHPELRLGQLIFAAVDRDPFYIEDDDLVEYCEKLPKNSQGTL